MTKCAILQSNYLPWKGVFDMINSVDKFVFLEDAQYTKNDWRNRNRIMTRNGSQWITVPVNHTGIYDGLRICEAQIKEGTHWAKKHLTSFKLNYSKSKYFKEYEWLLEDIYINNNWGKISEVNIYCIKKICNILKIKTEFYNSVDLNCNGRKDDKIVEICKKLGADYYLSGPAAKNYIVHEKFETNGIELSYIDYVYPEYFQLSKEFEHYVTVLDLIFNCGEESPHYIWGWRDI